MMMMMMMMMIMMMMMMMIMLELKKSQIKNKIDQGNVENCRDQIKCFLELINGNSPTLSSF